MTDEEKIRAAYKDMTTRRHSVRGYGGRICWAVPPEPPTSVTYDHDAVCALNMDVVEFQLLGGIVVGEFNGTTIRLLG